MTSSPLKTTIRGAELLISIFGGWPSFHERWPEKRTFAWQAGYGAFAVSSSNAERVIHYIATQEQHHQKLSFRDEFVTLLRRHGVSFDEQYLWS